jgi:plasmid stability protein
MVQETESRWLEKVIVRLPDGMRDRLKKAAADNNRSMNAEIVDRLEDSFEDAVRLPADLRSRIEVSANDHMRSVNAEAIQVLQQFFPPEPTTDELLESIEMFVRWSRYPSAPHYKKKLVDAIAALGDRIEKGIEFDTVRPMVQSQEDVARPEAYKKSSAQRRKWKNDTESDVGVSTEDFANALKDGFLSYVSRDRVEPALVAFDHGDLDRAFAVLGLKDIKFQDRSTAAEALEAAAREHYQQWAEDDWPDDEAGQ